MAASIGRDARPLRRDDERGVARIQAVANRAGDGAITHGDLAPLGEGLLPREGQSDRVGRRVVRRGNATCVGWGIVFFLACFVEVAVIR